MKKFSKKLISAILLMGLILTSLSPMVVNAAGDGTITLKNPTKDKSYTLYRVFDLTYNETAGAYTYRVSKKDFENILIAQYPQLDSGKTMTQGGVTYKIIDAQPLIDKDYSKDIGGTTYKYINPYDFSIWLNTVANPETNFSKNTDVKTGKASGELSWNNLDLGYYMVKSDAGTVVSLTTTDKNADVYEKNILPTLTKKVKGGSARDFADLAYADLGEELEFKITLDVHNHANTEYILKDIVPKGIDVTDDTLEVKLGTDTMTTNNTDQKLKYELTKKFTANTPEDGIKNLEIKFPLATIQAIAASLRGENATVEGTGLGTKATITITYKGKLNNTALMSNHQGLNDNKNGASLKYDPNTDIDEVTASAVVRTTDFNIFKFFKKDTNKTSLAGAKFKIYTDETGGNALKFEQVTGQQSYNYKSEGSVDEITTDITGKFNIRGLKTGTYYIEETAAPDGFNQLQKRVKLVIAEDTSASPATKLVYKATISDTEETLAGNTVEIENQGGNKLPETGGMGRTMIYTAGGLLFFGALVLLIARKKTKEDRA